MTTVDYEQMLLPERLARIDDVLSLRTRTLALLLESVHDPHNASACLRSAEAFGVQDVHVVEAGTPFRPRRRVVQGTAKWLDVTRHAETRPCLARLREAGYRIYTSDLRATRLLHDLDFSMPCVLAFGNEHEGASPALVEGADETFLIPMRGFCESFNVSVAVALSLHYAVSARFGRSDAPGDLAEEDRQRLRDDWIRKSVRNHKSIEALGAYDPARTPR